MHEGDRDDEHGQACSWSANRAKSCSYAALLADPPVQAYSFGGFLSRTRLEDQCSTGFLELLDRELIVHCFNAGKL